jgi:O-acetyl-ADP-ribose deacetylase (regulator of RNase III)
MDYTEIKGDLVLMAQQGKFDVIAHGCNCFATQRSGIAKRMVEIFKTDLFRMETANMAPMDRLANIDWNIFKFSNGVKSLTVINAYTQYEYGTDKVNLDYEALRICMRKINVLCANQHIGLPKIGCGLAGGDWEVVKKIIQEELTSMKITIVIYE